MREQFEKLPEIAKIIKEREAFYCNKGDYYLCPDEQFAESYLDGAWYVYQEQQKKIEEVLKQLETFQEQYWSEWKEKADMMDQGASLAYEHAYWMLKEVLQ